MVLNIANNTKKRNKMTENTKSALLEENGVSTYQYLITGTDLTSDSLVDNMIVQILADRDRIEAYVADRKVLNETISDDAELNIDDALSSVFNRLAEMDTVGRVRKVQIDGRMGVMVTVGDRDAHIDRPFYKNGVRMCVRPTTTLLGSTLCCNIYNIACIGGDHVYRATVRVNMTDGSATTDGIVSNITPESEVKLLKALLGGGCPEVIQDWVIGRLATLIGSTTITTIKE